MTIAHYNLIAALRTALLALGFSFTSSSPGFDALQASFIVLEI
jgi:hypothetical protein